MLTTFDALAPIFALILLGAGLRAADAMPEDFARRAEWLVYWIMFPALLFRTISTADATGLRIGPVALALLVAILAMAALMLLLRQGLGLGGRAFSSVFQGAIRPNTYVGLAGAEALYGQAGLVVMGVAIFVVVVAVNILSVVALLRFGDSGAPRPALIGSVLRNPLVLACLAGFLMNAANVELWSVAGQTLDILARASLPLALLCVGAALHLEQLRAASVPALATHGAKLLLLPMLTAGCCWLFRVEGLTAAAAILLNAAPISASSFVLARQLGGDAPLMASLITGSTLAAFFTMPVVLTLLA